MRLQQEVEQLSQRAALPGVSADLLAVAHKLAHPMADILAKVPGDSLTARAKACGVARQTMYAWAQERFRPSRTQAAIIAELTGVPAEHIADYQEGNSDERTPTKPAGKKIARLAKASRHLSAGAARLRAERTGMGLEQGKRRHDRKAVGRNPRRPVGGEGD